MSELDELRKHIDNLDKMIVSAYVARLRAVESIGEYKKKHNIDIINTEREKEVYKNIISFSGDYEQDVRYLYKYILEYSKIKQREK